MKKIWCLMLAISLVFSMTACQQEETVQKETEQETPAGIQENTPEETKPPQQKTTCHGQKESTRCRRSAERLRGRPKPMFGN